jgi:hypothetical protein|tara:strand:- start:68 stop:1003 length:936 start_codon:yes stop_codon:yes gene_type:complete
MDDLSEKTNLTQEYSLSDNIKKEIISPLESNTLLDEFEPIYTNEYLKSVNDFYKLKGKYEGILRRKKQKIINNPTLSKSDRRKMWANEKIKCINCSKPVGTFFSVKNRRLIAHCGALNNPSSNFEPCKLNIDIQLPSVTTLQETINNFNKYKEEDKEAIIQTKLKLLFGFLSENEALNLFENQRKEYNEDQETYNDYLELFVSIHNSKQKREMIQNLITKKETIITEIKNLIKSGSIDNMIPIIRDTTIMQVNQLDELIIRIRELSYDYYGVEENEDNLNQHKLVIQPVSIQRSEIVIDNEAKINHFVVNK